MLALSGIVTVGPDGEGGDDKPLDNVPAAARSHPTPRGLGSANRRLMLVIHVPLFGPPPTINAFGLVCVSQVSYVPRVSLRVRKRASPFLCLVHMCSCVCWCDPVIFPLANVYQVCPQRCVSTHMGTCASLSAGVCRCSPTCRHPLPPLSRLIFFPTLRSSS